MRNINLISSLLFPIGDPGDLRFYGNSFWHKMIGPNQPTNLTICSAFNVPSKTNSPQDLNGDYIIL